MKIQTDWHKSAKGCWSLTLGWRGCRVRVTQREPGGVFYGITWIAGRGQDWKSFGTTSRSEATRSRPSVGLASAGGEPLSIVSRSVVGFLGA